MNPDVTEWTARVPKEPDKYLFVLIFIQVDRSAKNIIQSENRCLQMGR
jgi:hypothetical protein